MEVVHCLVALVVVLVLGQFLHVKLAAKRLPPGPSPLPILGNLWTLRFTFHHETLRQLAKTYGNTMTLWLGRVPVIVFTGYEAVQNMVVSDETSGRPLTPVLKVFGQKRGIIGSSGHTWKQQRRFSLLMLRSLGVGKKSMDHRIQEEARHLVDFLASLEGRPIDPNSPIMVSMTNVISAVVFGHRFTNDDPALHWLIDAINLAGPFYNSFWGQLYETFPRMMNLLPGPHQKYFRSLEYTRDYIKKEVILHKEYPSDEPRDMIDLYLNQIAKFSENENTVYKLGETVAIVPTNEPNSTYDEANMVQVLFDLFYTGSDTTTMTLLWGLLYMLKYPDIQDQVQQELGSVIEPTEIIQYEHRKKLPYTNAVIHEILRFSSLVPVGLPRECTKDTIIEGYHIAKGSFLVYNLFSALNDENHWEKPQVFNPNRYLDEDGNFATKEALIPFSAGQRSCLGEQLARVELFIFFTNLLREFTFRLPDGVKTVNLGCTFGTVLHPMPYEICAIPNQASNDCST